MVIKVVGENDACRKCGKCCKLMQSLKSYDELCELSQNGDKAAANFLKLFMPYETIEKAMEIDPIAINKIIEINKKKFGSDTKTYFYCCRYLKDDNTCKVYDVRPNLCKEYPKSPFTVVPENCGYEGYLFEAKENVKKYVRKMKEELLDISVIKQNSTDLNEIKRFNNIENKYSAIINKYSEYGSNDW